MKTLVIKSLIISVSVNIFRCSDEYKYKLIDSQERPRRSDSSGPGPYLQKDSFFNSGFLEDLFGFGRPEPSLQVKRENNAPSRYPYHGQPYGPSPPQNNHYNPYIAPSPIPHDPHPFSGPFFSGVPIKSNSQKPTFRPKVINPTVNPYTYRVTAATNHPSLKNLEPNNFPFQPVFPAYGYNTTPYPSTPPPTNSNIEPQDHSALKPHHDFSSSSSPQYENPEPKLDQFFTIKPFTHKVRPFVHKEKPESTVNTGLSVKNGLGSMQPVALNQQILNHNVVQDRPYSAPQQNFPKAGYLGQSSSPYAPQSNFAGQNNYINPIQKEVKPSLGSPSMESLLAKIDINSQRQNQNAPPAALSNINNVHSSFSNGLQHHLIAQQSDVHIKNHFNQPQNLINPQVQHNHQMPQIPHEMTAISKPEQFFMLNAVQKDNNHQSVQAHNMHTPNSFHVNPVTVPEEQSFDVFRQNIEQTGNNKQVEASFTNPLRQKQTKEVSLKTVQQISQPSPYTYSLLSNSASNRSHSSFQQVSLPRIQEISHQKQQQFQNPQSFVHKPSSENNIGIHPFVDQTSVEHKNGPQTFHASQQMSHISSPSIQKDMTHSIPSESPPNFQPSKASHQSQNFQTFATNNPMLDKDINHNTNQMPVHKPLEVKNLENTQNAIIPKDTEVQIGTPPRFVFNLNEKPIQDNSRQSHPSVQNQTPISVSPNTNNGQLTNALQPEKLFPSTHTPAATSVYLSTPINREMLSSVVKTSGPSSKPTAEKNFEELHNNDFIHGNSVIQSNSVNSKFKEVKIEALDSQKNNNKLKEAAAVHGLQEIPLKNIPKDAFNQQNIDKSFDIKDEKRPNNELFTSFPSRDKSKKYSLAEKNVEEKKKIFQKELKQKTNKRTKINQTRRKPMNIEEKEVNKADSLQKLLAIAGAGWDTTEKFEKSIKSANSKFKCPKPEGHFADPDRCQVYYRCVHGRSTQLQCGAGLKWNSKTNQCDWGDNVDCGLNRVPRSGDSVGDKK